MCLKTETLVDTNGMDVVFKDIEDNRRELLVEQHRDQCCGNCCSISLPARFWGCQDISEYGDPGPRCQSMCPPSGDDPLLLICAKVQTVCKEVCGKRAFRMLDIEVLQRG